MSPLLNLLIVCIFYLVWMIPVAHGQDSKPKKPGPQAIEMRYMFLDWLDVMKDAIKEEYYDPKYRGIDLNARFDAAKSTIQSLDYDWQMFAVFSQLLMDLEDSHTYLILPPRKNYFDYGFSMQIVGADCLVTGVAKNGGAEKAGIEVGDKIVRIGAIAPSRDTLWKILYVIYQLDPPETLELTVKKAGSAPRTLTVAASVLSNKEYHAERKKRRDEERQAPYKCSEISKEIIACKLYTFDTQNGDIDRMMKSVAGHSKLILDLRGNGGGLASTAQYMTGYFFDHDVKMLDEIRRKKTEARIAKSKRDKAFKGELLVLVDSQSASASEVFARVIQIEKRGKIVGDHSSGSVMTSGVMALVLTNQRFGYRTKVFPLALSMSIADVVMSDGGRLESKGVVPDATIIPTSLSLKQDLDPVLAAASAMFGHNLSPEAAGKMHFRKQSSNDPYQLDDVQSENP